MGCSLQNVLYKGDLSSFKPFARDRSDEVMFSELKASQEELQCCSAANHVILDPGL